MTITATLAGQTYQLDLPREPMVGDRITVAGRSCVVKSRHWCGGVVEGYRLCVVLEQTKEQVQV